MCHIHNIYMYSSIKHVETAPLCKILEQSRPLFMAILHWGIQQCCHWQFFSVVSDTSPLYGDIAFLRFEGYKSFVNECSLDFNLVIDNFLYVALGTSPLYTIWKQSDHYLWRYCILKIWGIQSVIWLRT